MHQEFVRPSQVEASELLANNDLPNDDVTQQLLENFLGLKQASVLIAMGGLEPLGDLGLLRSVVVRNEFRGQGIATRLVNKIETNAAATGVNCLYLLTTDAADYFAKLGYTIVERKDVPISVRNTSQFSELCPDTASVMRKYLV